MTQPPSLAGMADVIAKRPSRSIQSAARQVLPLWEPVRGLWDAHIRHVLPYMIPARISGMLPVEFGTIAEHVSIIA